MLLDMCEDGPQKAQSQQSYLLRLAVMSSPINSPHFFTMLVGPASLLRPFSFFPSPSASILLHKL
jgi:hypothetical protein